MARRPTLTASARAGVRNLRSGRKKACGAVEQKKAQKQGRKRPQKSGLTVPRSYNPHNRGRGASAYHRPRVRSLPAFGRRPPCTWLRRSWPASETLRTSGLMHRSKRSSSCTAIRSPRRRGQKRRRHVEAERLRHDQVNEVELGRLLDRKIGGLRPPQNLVD